MYHVHIINCVCICTHQSPTNNIYSRKCNYHLNTIMKLKWNTLLFLLITKPHWFCFCFVFFLLIAWNRHWIIGSYFGSENECTRSMIPCNDVSMETEKDQADLVSIEYMVFTYIPDSVAPCLKVKCEIHYLPDL